MRFLTIAFTACSVMMTSVLLAKGGDDDKKKGGKKVKSGIVYQDTSKTDYFGDPKTIAVDDTLVFEDWENPGDLGGDDKDGLGGIADGSGSLDDNKDGSRYKSFDQSENINFNTVYNTFKKEYRVEFKIYPNPTTEQLHINPEVNPLAIRIADINGKVHKSLEYIDHVNVSTLPTGTYFIQLIYPDHLEARKFIKR